MFKFLLTLAIVLLMFLVKLFFFRLEDEYASSAAGVFDLISVFGAICVAVYLFVKDFQKNKLSNEKRKTSRYKPDAVFVGLFIVIVIVLGMSLRINLRKKSIHWDAVALYDARAIFLENGMKFSEMPQLSKYDDRNKYYYLLYPPYTSVGHLFWRNNPMLTEIPVSVYYSVYLTLLALIIFLTTKEYLGLRASLLLSLISISNISIFNIAIKEYTNLPFTLHIVGGVLLLASYIRKRRPWELIMGIFLVSTSLWIRLLEPIWIAIGFAFAGALLTKKNLFKNLWPFVALMLFSLFQYVFWLYFVKGIAGNPGFVNFSLQFMIEPIIGIFTGAPFVVIITVIKNWSLPFLIHFLAVTSLLLKYKYVLKNRAVLFLGLVVFFSTLLYLAEFYLLSFQYDWWAIVSMSLDRSSTFLMPISAYILIWSIINSRASLKRG